VVADDATMDRRGFPRCGQSYALAMCDGRLQAFLGLCHAAERGAHIRRVVLAERPARAGPKRSCLKICVFWALPPPSRGYFTYYGLLGSSLTWVMKFNRKVRSGNKARHVPCWMSAIPWMGLWVAGISCHPR